jgi:hypothetical protein
MGWVASFQAESCSQPDGGIKRNQGYSRGMPHARRGVPSGRRCPAIYGGWCVKRHSSHADVEAPAR